jgi:hypothetical protein
LFLQLFLFHVARCSFTAFSTLPVPSQVSRATEGMTFGRH